MPEKDSFNFTLATTYDEFKAHLLADEKTKILIESNPEDVIRNSYRAMMSKTLIAYTIKSYETLATANKPGIWDLNNGTDPKGNFHNLGERFKGIAETFDCVVCSNKTLAYLRKVEGYKSTEANMDDTGAIVGNLYDKIAVMSVGAPYFGVVQNPDSILLVNTTSLNVQFIFLKDIDGYSR